MAGFKKKSGPALVLEANTSPRADMQMEPGSRTRRWKSGRARLFCRRSAPTPAAPWTRSSSKNCRWASTAIFRICLDLVPGTMEETFQHSQFFNASSSLQTNINGQPRMGNNYQIEGIDNNERTGLLQILITPAEAIPTVSVSTTNHDPELGRGTGAVTNVMIKSGTNSIHGAAYWFLQNSAFDARSFFNPSVGHLAYNQVGGNMGGPIKKNKLFFFVNYLRTMDHEANTNQETIPADAFRTGRLERRPDHIMYDPATGICRTDPGRTPFPGNIIPASRINPISAKILGLSPADQRDLR